MNEAEFKELCRAVFNNADPAADESYLLQQLLVLARSRVGHSRPGTGAFHTGSSIAATVRQEILSLLLMRREPFFEPGKIIDEFLDSSRHRSCGQ
jgi:hypothetical protein